jgi:hypothetical protein
MSTVAASSSGSSACVATRPAPDAGARSCCATSVSSPSRRAALVAITALRVCASHGLVCDGVVRGETNWRLRLLAQSRPGLPHVKRVPVGRPRPARGADGDVSPATRACRLIDFDEQFAVYNSTEACAILSNALHCVRLPGRLRASSPANGLAAARIENAVNLYLYACGTALGSLQLKNVLKRFGGNLSYVVLRGTNPDRQYEKKVGSHILTAEPCSCRRLSTPSSLTRSRKRGWSVLSR